MTPPPRPLSPPYAPFTRPSLLDSGWLESIITKTVIESKPMAKIAIAIEFYGKS